MRKKILLSQCSLLGVVWEYKHNNSSVLPILRTKQCSHKSKNQKYNMNGNRRKSPFLLFSIHIWTDFNGIKTKSLNLVKIHSTVSYIMFIALVLHASYVIHYYGSKEKKFVDSNFFIFCIFFYQSFGTFWILHPFGCFILVVVTLTIPFQIVSFFYTFYPNSWKMNFSSLVFDSVDCLFKSMNKT